MTDSTLNPLLKKGHATFSGLTEKKKSSLYIACTLITSILIKSALLIIVHDADINTDGILYIKAAMEFAAGNFAGGIDIYPMPAYPLILAVAHMIISDWIMSGYIVSIACMVLVTIPLFHITRISAGPHAAFWACLVFAVLPQMNEWTFYISRDPIFLLTVSWFVYFALRSIRQNDNNTAAFIGAFLLAWLSIFFRVEGCIILFFYLTVLIGLGLLKKKQKQFYFFRAFLWIAIPAIIASILFFFTGPESLSVNRLSFIYDKLGTFLNGEFLQQYHEMYHFFEKAENNEPFSGWHYNLAALARHYIFLLYTAGIIEILIKNIFFLSCIPLFIGLKTKGVSHSKFFLYLWLLFIALAYYCLLTKDFLATRFLLIPSFLLLPWIGAGIENLRIKAFSGRHKTMILFLIAVLITAPAAKSFEQVLSKDGAVPSAVKWMLRNDILSENKVMTTEKAALFYAELYSPDNNKIGQKLFYCKPKDTTDICTQFLYKKKIDLILIKTGKKKADSFFSHYKIEKIFADNINRVILYRRPKQEQGSLVSQL